VDLLLVVAAKGGRKSLHYCRLETTMMEVFVQNDWMSSNRFGF
jgi:hypothetical protein